MPFAPPPLDTRNFEELLREARLRIPRYAPQWTDFNDSDPGMAIVQLFAWFTEQMLFQLNRVPERTYVEFLNLLNLSPRPAQPATAIVVFQPQPGAASTTVPTGSVVTATGVDGGQIPFQTMASLDLVPHDLKHVQVFDGAEFADVTTLNAPAPAGTRAEGFQPFGPFPQIGAALYFGFEPPEGSHGSRFPAQVSIRTFLPAKLRANTETGRPRLVCEYLALGSIWRPLSIEDQTQGLTREGVLNFDGPIDPVPHSIGKVTEPMFWVRVRIASGGYPPGAAPTVELLRTNAVVVTARVTISNEVLGRTDGVARAFQLANTPVDPTSLELVTELPGRDPQKWQRVASFYDAGVDNNSAVYTLEPDGTLRFGDGRRGRIPEPGGTLIARRYSAGGGANGNVAAGAITGPPPTLATVEVANPRRAVGGENAETMQLAQERAPLYLRSRGRAVTTEDFRHYAERVPGVSRAFVLSNRHPEYPGASVPGAVTVVVVPLPNPVDIDAPPEVDLDADLKRAVKDELDRYRLLTTELAIRGPCAIRLNVQVEVVPDPTVSHREVTDAVTAAVKAALRPYPPGGLIPTSEPDGSVAIYLGSLYEVLLKLEQSARKTRLLRTVTKLDWELADGQKLPEKEKLTLQSADIPWCVAVQVEVKT